MGLFSTPRGPNAKMYVLLDADGDQFVFRHGGKKIAEWDLRGAIGMADHMADQGEDLHVADPDTGLTLWHGQEAVR